MCGINSFLAINFIIFIATIQCLKMVPERANVSEISTKFIEYARFYVSRVSRESPYFMNIEGITKQQYGNNVTINLLFFEYLHNEYRRSFVEVHGRICDLIDKDPLIGFMFRKLGVKCPFKQGEYHFLNLTLPIEKFPYQFPFSKFRVDIDAITTDTKEFIARAYLYGSLKNK